MDLDATVVGDLVARDRRTDDPLVRFGDGTADFYTAHKFCTDAWKTANLFRYNGVGSGRTVGIADDRVPPALLSFFGTALLGATVRFDPPTETDVRLLVADAAAVADWTLPPGSKRVAYDGPPEDPSVAHFERDVWSENPTMPPDEPDADDPVLVTADDRYTHADLVAATARVVDDLALTADDAVAVRAPLADPGTVIAGVLAPVAVGAEVHLPGVSEPGTVAVTTEDAPEPRSVTPTEARDDR
jgi:acyl-CoA synthetase (AMP-forming)/AMP-acid ligase II